MYSHNTIFECILAYIKQQAHIVFYHCRSKILPTYTDSILVINTSNCNRETLKEVGVGIVMIGTDHEIEGSLSLLLYTSLASRARAQSGD